MTKQIRKEVTVLHLADIPVLTPMQEADLRDLINFADGLFIRSNMGSLAELQETGLLSTKGNAYDPDGAMIRSLDTIRKHRRIHRALLAIGGHSRALIQAYTIGKIPTPVLSRFGVLSGIALSRVGSPKRLVEACARLVRHQSDDPDSGYTKEDAKLISNVHQDVSPRYRVACKKYIDALERLDREKLVKTPARERVAVPHVCRVGSALYRCPCKTVFREDV
jgi:hypothetical protein